MREQGATHGGNPAYGLTSPAVGAAFVLRVGLPVEVVYDDVTQEVTLPGNKFGGIPIRRLFTAWIIAPCLRVAAGKKHLS